VPGVSFYKATTHLLSSRLRCSVKNYPILSATSYLIAVLFITTKLYTSYITFSTFLNIIINFFSNNKVNKKKDIIMLKHVFKPLTVKVLSPKKAAYSNE